MQLAIINLDLSKIDVAIAATSANDDPRCLATLFRLYSFKWAVEVKQTEVLHDT